MESFFRLFSNYAGRAANIYGEYPLSFVELSRPTGKYVSRLLIRELNLLTRRHSIVMIGNSCVPGYFFPKLEPDKGLEQFVRDVAAPCGIFIANVPSETITCSTAVEFEAEPFMVLKIEKHWTHFDNYLQDMVSKYRIRAKRALEISQPLELQVYMGDQIPEDILKRCCDLLQQTLREKTVAMSNDLQGIIRRFADHFGHEMQLRTYWQNGEIVGFITCTIQGEQLTAWHVGYEAEIAKKYHIYQRMLYELVETGIEFRCSCINFGRTATEIKSTLGAAPQQNKFVIFVKNPIIRRLLKNYQLRHYKPKDYTIRRPFKNGYDR